MTAKTESVLEFAGIEKSFGAAPVLRGVSFHVERGEVHALLGENGAGKSTLMRILLGAERADGGAMTLGGRSYAPANPKEARRSGVVMVPQERTLCLDLTVLENIALGIEPSRFGVIRRREAHDLAARALELALGTTRSIPLDARVRDLSVADRQLVEIARALAQAGTSSTAELRASVVVLDEPTSSLGHDDAKRLFERVHALRSTGVAVLLVTHFLGDVRGHADRYTVLRDGKVAGEGVAKETPPERIVAEMLGRELEAALAETAPPSRIGDTLLEVDALGGHARPEVASFVLKRGEVFGIAGLVGAGRTELLRIIAGLDEPARGRVASRAPNGIGLLSEDRGGEGLMLRRSIAENVVLSRKSAFLSLPSRILAEGARWIGELGVKAEGPAQPVVELSGGNQQKVQIARLLREDYDVLLVDEPTRGVDVASKAQILTLLRELARKGKGIVLVSSQFDELVSAYDRIAVLAHGKLGTPRAASEWTEETLLLEAAS